MCFRGFDDAKELNFDEAIREVVDTGRRVPTFKNWIMEFCLKKTSDKKETGSPEELDSFRFLNGRYFPPSYREFAKQYGYGRSGGEFIIYIPMDDYGDDFIRRSAAIKETYSNVLGAPDDVWFELEPDANFDILKRLVPFAMGENGHYLFWNIESGEDEMDIYITDFRGLGFVKAANDLCEFFEKITSTERFKEVFPLFRQSPLPSTFEPFI